MHTTKNATRVRTLSEAEEMVSQLLPFKYNTCSADFYNENSTRFYNEFLNNTTPRSNDNESENERKQRQFFEGLKLCLRENNEVYVVFSYDTPIAFYNPSIKLDDVTTSGYVHNEAWYSMTTSRHKSKLNVQEYTYDGYEFEKKSY